MSYPLVYDGNTLSASAHNQLKAVFDVADQNPSFLIHARLFFDDEFFIVPIFADSNNSEHLLCHNFLYPITS